MKMTEMTIPMLRHGCFHCQFDQNYPCELNGIVNEEEFTRSMELVNASSRLSFLQKLSVFLSILILLIGLTLSILGGILQETLHEKKYFVLVGGGVLMIIGGSLFYLFIYLKINENRLIRMNRQIEFESRKYSHRTGQSLRWILKQTPSTNKSHRNEHFNFINYQFEIVIEIDRNDLPNYEKIISSNFFQVNEDKEIPPPLYSDLYH